LDAELELFFGAMISHAEALARGASADALDDLQYF
jgi:hypothetical protein